MNLKSFTSYSIALIVMLISFTVYTSINKIVSNYEQNINDDYSIVVVSTIPLNKSKINDISNIEVKNIVHLDKEKILKSLNEDTSSGTFDLLQKKLPYFYTISLQNFPTSSTLLQIKTHLEKITSIKRVETFSKNHDNMYSLLLLIKTIVSILFVSILIFALLLMLDNVKIWLFQHSNRLNIIKLHGGSIFYGAKPIIKIAILSSIFSFLFTILTVYYLGVNLDKLLEPELSNIILTNLKPYTISEIFKLLIISIALSFFTVFGILIKHRIK